MSTIITGGQSFEDVGAAVTIGGAVYGSAIASQNNMDGQSITGQKFRLDIPDEWMLPGMAGKNITLASVGGNPISGIAAYLPWIVGAVVVLGLMR